MKPADVLDFWFGRRRDDPPKAKRKRWFVSTANHDALIRERFEEQLVRLVARECEAWLNTPEGRLAAIIVLDQLSRNIYRGDRRAFDGDPQALDICLEGLRLDVPEALGPYEQAFFCMPLTHSEVLEHHDRVVELFRRLVLAWPDHGEGMVGFHESAMEHREVIRRFGRYPHRNEVLGRSSTAAELEYLASGGSRYGQ